MNGFIQANSEKVFLPMNMTGRDFAQARLMSYLEETGFIAQPVFNTSGTGQESENNCDAKDIQADNIFAKTAVCNDWTFIPWKFSDTAEENDGMVIWGSGFQGTTLYDFLLPEQTGQANNFKQERQKAVYCVSAIQKALKCAESSNIQLPFTCPSQILLSDDGRILFLPPTLVDRAAAAKKDKEYSRLAGCWIHPGLFEKDANRFSLCSLFYTAITGRLAFPNFNSDKRSEDLFDKNFIPIDCIIQNIKASDAYVINSNLSGKKPLLKVPDILPDMASGYLFSDKAQDETSCNSFKDKAQKRIDSLQKRIKTKRFLRKHQSGLTVIGIIFAAAICIVAVTFNNKQDSPTTQGLTSFQTVEAFYSAVNRMDTEQLGACTSGNAGGNYTNVVSAFYVNGKMRESYESVKLLTPAIWMYSYAAGYAKNTTYGITDFKINGDNASSSFICHSRKQKAAPISSENGKPIAEGDTASYTVTFYSLNTDANITFTVQQCTDTVILSFKGNKWQIIKITSNIDELSVNSANFLSDFNSSFPDSIRKMPEKSLLPVDFDISEENITANTFTIANADFPYSTQKEIEPYVADIVESLRNSYSWLPRHDEMETARIQAAGSFGIPE